MVRRRRRVGSEVTVDTVLIPIPMPSPISSPPILMGFSILQRRRQRLHPNNNNNTTIPIFPLGCKARSIIIIMLRQPLQPITRSIPGSSPNTHGSFLIIDSDQVGFRFWNILRGLDVG